ncbi:LysR family transcriptional regulator [Ramlibacter sp. MAHUQ-53]|uniref:LysR family transcriptional regulator n=1 Tax=unclassified Ramlibacter TaxID=2617605 RepID=UPI003629C64F
MDINLRHLRTFLEVAEAGSFRDASGQIHRSFSVVSTQVRQLEEQLGVALFHRTTRSVKLTAAGLVLRDAARKGFREIEAGVRELQETLDLGRGRITLASSPIMAATLLPPWLARFEAEYPAIQIRVHELTPAGILESVASGDSDFGIGPAAPGAGVKFEPLLEESLMALVPRRLKATAAGTITLREVSRLPVLLLSEATALRGMFDEACRKAGIALAPKYESTQAQTLIAMANVELGAAILPRSVLPARPDRRVQALRIVSPALSRRIGLFTASRRALSPAAARLAEVIRAGARA